ncbi:MAG: hypothetical protein EON98_15480 [Chitinophagaceae bacterium]|nr:MAG: hypothetical protein EON98_15480 [Chitinophagaceae bacterium]
MPTQNFLLTEFFLPATEAETKQRIIDLPNQLPNVTLLKENTLLHSTRFLYEHPDKQTKHYVDVAVLPLDIHYVLVRLHGAYTNGKSFQADPDLQMALGHFEQALTALTNNEEVGAIIEKTNKKEPRKTKSLSNMILSIFFSRNLQHDRI